MPSVSGTLAVRKSDLYSVCGLTKFQALIVDGLLAWRLYVIYGRARWALYVPTLAVAISARTSKFLLRKTSGLTWTWTVLGLVSNCQYLAYYHNAEEYTSHWEVIVFQILVAWGWMIFATNTCLTGLIIGRILCVTWMG